MSESLLRPVKPLRVSSPIAIKANPISEFCRSKIRRSLLLCGMAALVLSACHPLFDQPRFKLKRLRKPTDMLDEPWDLRDLIHKLNARGYKLKRAYLQKQGRDSREMWVLSDMSGTRQDVVLPLSDVVDFANGVATIEEVLERIASMQKNRERSHTRKDN